jgi:NadR type nicotinamide-nucleotide adenylyltransferase
MKKIVVIGPECTGKSTLCEQLAEYYKGSWCPEFARDFLKQHGKDYSYNDLLTIAHGQLALEDHLMLDAKGKYFFIDTDMHVMKVWCEVAFENCHSWILKQIALRKYDLYLLCKPDLPWVADELREYPDPEFRKKLYKMYLDQMVNERVRFAEIGGSHSQRLQSAISMIDALFE